MATATDQVFILRNLFHNKLKICQEIYFLGNYGKFQGGGVKQVGIMAMNHNALWSLCLNIMGNNYTIVLMHNALIYNMFLRKYVTNTTYLQNS